MVDTVRLRFPLLSDQGRERAVNSYGVWHQDVSVANRWSSGSVRTADTAYRYLGSDVAGRPPTATSSLTCGRCTVP